MNAISHIESEAVSLSNPLDKLFAQYRQDRAEIERIAGFVADAKAMHYFFEAASIERRATHVSAGDVFRLEPAIRALDATYWQRAMLLTDVMEYMPAGKRNDWNEQIHDHKTVPFEFESVKLTLVQMLNNRAQFMAERVDGLFRALSGDHVTNQPQGFGKRFIMGYMLSYSSVCHTRANYIHDLRCVIGKFTGRDVPRSANTYHDLNCIARDGQWNEFDGGAFKIRLYKKGTAHMEVHPDIAWQLNKVLAHLYPMAIPPEFRQKPKKQPKQHRLHDNLVSFEVLKELDDGIPYHSRGAKHLTWAHKAGPSAPTIEVMEYLGGVKTGKDTWEFGFTVCDVIRELNRTGRIPEQKSHQYYPTTGKLAQDAIELAQIEDGSECCEPSAGQGGLADHMPKDRTTCVEISPLHCKVLEAKGFTVECADFLTWGAGRKFDRIVMNPPFSDRRAEDHVKHAATLLATGGRLVAIMPASYQGKTIAQGMAHEWSKVYPNEFKDASVSVVILALEAA